MDFANLKARKVAVYTDATVSKLRPMKEAVKSLEANSVPYEVFDTCRVEPNQQRCAPKLLRFVVLSVKKLDRCHRLC